ncbi:hypothetical protein V493_03136 [Pseudogymnoascus sp. VKM F-4281 (FW-2241)]|nr:hypothetical protein V493_03136 [Pseudogymnoascus sp. VKM F-4281 (FW-2241)]
MTDTPASRKRAKSVTFATPPPSRENIAFRSRTALILGALTLSGAYLHFYQSANNGLFESLGELVKADTFPVSNGEFKRVFTGIKPLDTYLTHFTPFFGILTHAGDDSSYLFWVWMIGQFGVQWAMFVMESLREGNKGSIISYIGLIGFLFQNLGLATVIPAFLLIATLTSTISRATSPTGLMSLLKVHNIDLNILPFSIVLAYFAPTICMMLPYPAINSHASWQGWMATWQFFPLYTVAIQWLLASFFKAVDQGRGLKLKSDEGKMVAYFWHARPLYIGALFIAGVFHVNVLAICLLPEWIMDNLPIAGTYRNVSFASVFLPPVPLPPFEVVSTIRGIHTFLIWDMFVSGLAALVWAALQTRNVSSRTFDAKWVLKAIGYTIVTGPSGAFVMAMWERDSAIVELLIEQAMKDK